MTHFSMADQLHPTSHHQVPVDWHTDDLFSEETNRSSLSWNPVNKTVLGTCQNICLAALCQVWWRENYGVFHKLGLFPFSQWNKHLTLHLNKTFSPISCPGLCWKVCNWPFCSTMTGCLPENNTKTSKTDSPIFSSNIRPWPHKCSPRKTVRFPNTVDNLSRIAVSL